MVWCAEKKWKLKISGATKLLKLNSHEKQWSKLWCWCVSCVLPVSCGWSHFSCVNSATICSNECTDWNSIDDNTATKSEIFKRANFLFISRKFRKSPTARAGFNSFLKIVCFLSELILFLSAQPKRNMKKLFLILSAFALFSCSSNDDADEQIAPPSVETPEEAAINFYFKGKRNGTPFEYAVAPHLTGYGYVFLNSHTSGGDPYFVSYGAAIQLNETEERMGVKFENLYSGYLEQEHAAFYDSLAGLTTNFLTEEQMFSGMKGLHVSYESPDGTTYSSMYGNQSGSSVTILSATQGVMPGGSLNTMTIIGQVRCRLYDPNNPSDMFSITDGKFKLYYQGYF